MSTYVHCMNCGRDGTIAMSRSDVQWSMRMFYNSDRLNQKHPPGFVHAPPPAIAWTGTSAPGAGLTQDGCVITCPDCWMKEPY